MNRSEKSENALRRLFAFSKSERRGILWLLPLLGVAALVVVYANRPSFEQSFLELADEKAKAGRETTADYTDAAIARESTAAAEPFCFDPNTATLQELCRLGFSARTAAGIIKYRKRGKRFEIPEDFATCYGVSLDDYTRLEPYIVIGDEFRVRKDDYADGGASSPRGESRGQDAVSGPFDPNDLDHEGFVALGFSERQAAVIVNYRESKGGFATADDFAKCYVVSEKQFDRLRPYIIIKERAEPTAKSAAAPRDFFKEPLELNGADSAALRSVSGIGAVLAERISDYRRRLGGFVRKEQLAEIGGMTEANYERIVKQIWVDSCVIQKIDVNFASHKNLVDRLGNHPYVTGKMLRKLLKERQLKGGWSNHGDIVRDNIMTQKEAERLAPYLIFVTQ